MIDITILQCPRHKHSSIFSSDLKEVKIIKKHFHGPLEVLWILARCLLYVVCKFPSWKESGVELGIVGSAHPTGYSPIPCHLVTLGCPHSRLDVQGFSSCLFFITILWALIKNLFYLFIFGYTGCSLLCTGFFYLQQVGATLCCHAQASLCNDFSCCRAWALVWMGFINWHTDLVALRHVRSSQTRDQSCVPCIDRQILNHWTIKKVLWECFILILKKQKLRFREVKCSEVKKLSQD